MNEGKRYYVSDTGLTEGVSLGRITVVLVSDFDRVTAERNSLQLLLNDRDEQLHTLGQSRRAEFDNGQAVDRKVAELGQGTCDVIAERKRQLRVEGWTLEGDDQSQGRLGAAAACYLLFSDDYPNAGHPPPVWPWAAKWWKPKDYRRDLIRAGALVLAEIKRIDRASIKGEFDICLGCFGSGTVSTGITEASSTICNGCNGCNGTGRENP
ncbi:hypothetical protein [Pseudomonas neuropathica]|uniref:Uncharacterized protein n=1 Tax=Pseudomonas neuropathica TaxID=2730425 RepID=A0ACC7MRV9_9PSED